MLIEKKKKKKFNDSDGNVGSVYRYISDFFYFTATREPSLTFVVDLEADGADALVRLQVEPHLVGHAHDQVRNEAAREAGVCVGEGGHQSHYCNTNDNFHLCNQSHNQNSLL